jgi:outer membrane protein assembly factor BamB
MRFHNISLVLASLFIPLCSLAQGDGRQAHAGAGFNLGDPLRVAWQFPSNETLNLSPSTDGRLLFIPLAHGNLCAIRGDTGKLVWKEEVGGEISTAPFAEGSAVLVANEIGNRESSAPARLTGALRSLGSESGVTLWMRTMASPVKGIITSEGQPVFAISSDGRLDAINKSNGQTIWSLQLPSAPDSPPSIDRNQIFIGANDGSLFAVDAKTGNVIWRYRTRGPVHARPFIAGDVVFSGSADGFLYAIDRVNGTKKWSVRTGAAVQAVAVVDNEVIAASLDNFVYGFSKDRGIRVWKRQLEGRPIAEPLVEGNSILFNPISGESAVVLNAHDGKILNTLPTGQDNNSGASPIVAGRSLIITTRAGIVGFSHPEG